LSSIWIRKKIVKITIVFLILNSILNTDYITANFKLSMDNMKTPLYTVYNLGWKCYCYISFRVIVVFSSITSFEKKKQTKNKKKTRQIWQFPLNLMYGLFHGILLFMALWRTTKTKRKMKRVNVVTILRW
jgi:hypothetical protein